MTGLSLVRVPSETWKAVPSMDELAPLRKPTITLLALPHLAPVNEHYLLLLPLPLITYLLPDLIRSAIAVLPQSVCRSRAAGASIIFPRAYLMPVILPLRWLHTIITLECRLFPPLKVPSAITLLSALPLLDRTESYLLFLAIVVD